MYTMEYRTKYGAFCFTPFVPDLITAKVLYLKYRWWGCKSVRIVEGFDTIIWETPEPVIESIENANPTDDLPF